MTAYSTTVWQRTARFTLSRPVQLSLYTLLCSLTLWTVYFSTSPDRIHDTFHAVRHHTLSVACH